jgi:hypothetical protein
LLSIRAKIGAGRPENRLPTTAGKQARCKERELDKTGREMAGDKRPDPRANNPRLAIRRTVAARAPGLRNTLPDRIDGFGTPPERRASTAVNPGIGIPAKERRDPVVREMIETGVRTGSRTGSGGRAERTRIRKPAN